MAFSQASDTITAMLRPAIASLRPKQWVKQLLVLAAPLAAGAVDDRHRWMPLVAALVAFSATASATYVVNDIVDREADRLHPRKKLRPIASGLLPMAAAVPLACMSAALGLVAALSVSAEFFAVVAVYAATTLMYSLKLKHVAVVELVVLVSGFVLRAVGGAVAAGVSISPWFFACVSAGSLLIAVGKREAEMAFPDSRPVLAAYTPTFLASTRTAAVAVALGAYAAWAFASPTVSVATQVSVAPFAFGAIKYSFLADAGKGGAPEEVVLSDRTLLFAGLLWVLLMGLSAY